MPESFHHAFDAVVSIGVMEHSEFLLLSEILLVDSIRANTVGTEYMPVWFRKMVWAMKLENSFKVFTITHRSRYTGGTYIQTCV